MSVVEAEDGEAAIALFFQEKPALVFLDVEMPGKNGFEVCEAIRASELGANVPILIATGSDDKESIDQGFNAGATQYKTKPINWSLLSRDCTSSKDMAPIGPFSKRHFSAGCFSSLTC